MTVHRMFQLRTFVNHKLKSHPAQSIYIVTDINLILPRGGGLDRGKPRRQNLKHDPSPSPHPWLYEFCYEIQNTLCLHLCNQECYYKSFKRTLYGPSYRFKQKNSGKMCQGSPTRYDRLKKKKKKMLV